LAGPGKKQIVEQVAKEATEAGIKKILTKAGAKEVDDALAAKLAGTSDPKEVSSILNNMSGAPKTPPRAPQELNVDRLEVSDDAKAAIKAATSGGDPKTVLTHDDVIAIAKGAGIDLKTHTLEQTRDTIARQLNLRQNIVDLSNKFDAARAEGNNAAATDYLAQIATLGRYSTEQGTDIARQLSARRIIANELASPMQRVFQLLDKAGVNPEVYAAKGANVDFSDANQVVRFYREMVPPKASEWIDEVRYNSMLSSPSTQIVNVSSNLGNTLVVAPIEKTLTGVLDAAHSAFTGAPRKHAIGEGGAYVKGYAKSVPEAIDRFKQVMSGAGEYTNLDNAAHMPLAAHGDNKVHDVLSFPMRLLEGFDQLFTTMTQSGVTAGLEHRAAKGIKVRNAANEAVAEAAYRVYRQPIGDKSQGYLLRAIDEPTNYLQRLRTSKNPVVAVPAKFTVPFVRTVMNIFKQGIEYSPAGLATLPGATKKTEQLSKAIMGTAVVGTAAALLGDDKLTWAEPTDAKKRDAFRAAGKQPYSLKVGENWYQFSKLPPVIAFNLAWVAGLDDAMKTSKVNENGFDNLLTAAAKYGQFLSDQTYVQSAGNFLKAVQGNQENFTQLIGSYPQQLVPFRGLMNWVATATDDTMRKINTDASFVDKQVQNFMLAIPGLREHVPERLDANGVGIPAQHPGLNAVSPVRVTTEEPAGADYYSMLEQKTQDNRNKTAMRDEQKKEGNTSAHAPDLGMSFAQTLNSYANMTSDQQKEWRKDPKNAYALNEAQYQDKKAKGELSDTEDFKAQDGLKRQAIEKDYDPRVKDLLGMSKGDITTYLQQHPDQKGLYDQAVELDKKLYDAGISTSLKFKNGLTVKKAGGSKKTGKGSRGGKIAVSKGKMPTLSMKTIKIASAPKVGKIKVAAAKAPKLKKPGKVTIKTKVA
jgi:hypothetical protein